MVQSRPAKGRPRRRRPVGKRGFGDSGLPTVYSEAEGSPLSDLDREIRRIVEALSRLRTPACPEERDLHAAVSAALADAGVAFAHEARLAPRCRIDFLAGRIGVEVKKGRPAPAALRAQLARYLASAELDAVVVVSQRAAALPRTIAGKPVALVTLDRLWGVALP